MRSKIQFNVAHVCTTGRVWSVYGPYLVRVCVARYSLYTLTLCATSSTGSYIWTYSHLKECKCVFRTTGEQTRDNALTLYGCRSCESEQS